MALLADGLDPHHIRFIDVDGIRTRYYEAGDGPPLVLFHGGQFGSHYSLDAWSLNLPGLAEHFHVYAVDKAGQGHTVPPADDADYTFTFTLQHARRLLEILSIRGAHLVGHSRGGLLVARLALDDPGVARSVVIVDSQTLAPDHPDFVPGSFYDELDRRRPPHLTARELARREPDAQSFNRDHVTPDFVDRLQANRQLPSLQRATERMQAIKGTVFMPDLNRYRQETVARIAEQGLPCPTLLIWACNDLSAPLYLGHGLYSVLCRHTPVADMHIFNQAGHYVFREHPAAFNRLLVGFCRQPR